MPSTSIAAEASLAHAGSVDRIEQRDTRRMRTEGLVERKALNSDKIAQSSEAQTQLILAQSEAQRRHNEEVRTSVFAVRDMVAWMAREVIPQGQRAPQHPSRGESNRHRTGRYDNHPRTVDSSHNRPRR